jgi:hypothetical protein
VTRSWFRPWGWIHRPISWEGGVVLALALLFCANVFLVVDRRSHSVSDTLYGVFPFIVPALLALDWVASRTGGKAARG